MRLNFTPKDPAQTDALYEDAEAFDRARSGPVKMMEAGAQEQPQN